MYGLTNMEYYRLCRDKIDFRCQYTTREMAVVYWFCWGNWTKKKLFDIAIVFTILAIYKLSTNKMDRQQRCKREEMCSYGTSPLFGTSSDYDDNKIDENNQT